MSDRAAHMSPTSTHSHGPRRREDAVDFNTSNAPRLRVSAVRGRPQLVLALAVTFAIAIAHIAATQSVSLVDAVKAGDLASARSLLAQHADANIAAADGTTPLHWA